MSNTVLYSTKSGVATISLNRPKRLNAINPELLKTLHDAIQAANDDDNVRVILLRGQGRAFCAGDDLKEFDQQVGTESETRAYIENIQNISRGLCLNQKMVVGAIHGWAVGGGLEWVINCDFVVMARTTRFFFPEISLGIFVTGGVTKLLVEQIGLSRAREMILLGEKYAATDALRLGFDWRIVEDSQVFEVGNDLAKRITALPINPVRNLKRVMRESSTLTLEQTLILETKATVEGFLDPQSAELVRERLH